MSHLEEAILQIIQEIDELKDRVNDLEGSTGESNDILATTAFPNNPFNNMIVVRTDLTGTNPGGELYRFDAAVNDWLRVN